MGGVKDIIVKVIPSKIANPFVKAHHYSGKVVNNSSLHFGVFLDGNLHGVMSFGPSMMKAGVQGLVSGTGWNEFIELNRMAFDEYLPRNSESRAISVAIRMIRKKAPHIKWIISFADGAQCGDGTIYRASGFLLTGIKANENSCVMGDGTPVQKFSVETHPAQPRPELGGASYYQLTGGKCDFQKYLDAVGGHKLKGYSLRYIYFVDKSAKERLTVPIIPFEKIDEIGAGMYKGRKMTISERK